MSPTTIRKKLTTFGAAWKWAWMRKLVAGPFPNAGLVYPKGEEKPPFMAWGEIEREIERGGLRDEEIADLWDCL
ncbi:MAG: hypothetical protein KDA75_08420 [Planctomycetaceae bacterium]|nr:hypothetical protein [Planctomycetaceae bacterium]